MKLFLSSLAPTATQAQRLAELAGKPAEEVRLVLIENAADVYNPTPAWVAEEREKIRSHRFNVEVIDLRDYVSDKERLEQQLSAFDVIFLGGGNTFYLRWILKESRADEIIRRLVASGTIYAGASAGALVAGPTLNNVELVDEKNLAPRIIREGLALTDNCVVAHKDNPSAGESVNRLNEALIADGFETVFISDNEAVVLIDGKFEII